MVAPLSSLANMEMALYGGFNTNLNAPSYLNGYMGGANSSYMNSSMFGYDNGYNYNPTFGQSIPSGYGTQTQQQESVFQGLNTSETKALMNDYKKSLAPSEGLLGCLAGNAAFGLAMNPRIIAHPWNTVKATFFAENATNKFFKTLKDNKAFQAAWKNPENSNILREAWLQHNKAVARCEGKLGAFRQSYKATGDVATMIKEVKALEAALESGNMEAITRQTAKLQHVYSSANTGFIGRGVKWCRNQIAKIIPESWTMMGTSVKEAVAAKSLSVTEAINDTKGIEGKIAELAKTSGTLNDAGKLAAKATTKTDFMHMLKRGGGVKGGLLFAGLELAMNFGKLKTAFQEDSTTGMKQLGQTSIKAAGNAAGWALGEAAGLWAFTKLGASVGTALGPGIGTLIGGVVGLVGGGLGMWLAGKATNAIVGQDIADDIEARKLTQSQEGQVQLLQNTMQRMQSGEDVSPEAQMAVQKFAELYA